MTPEERRARIAIIRDFPPRLRALVEGLSDEQLTTPYLLHEWTVAQNVHHLPDSHMNSYVRLKLILTEERPTLKPYDQERWAELPDMFSVPISASLTLLEGLHARWTALFERITDEQWGWAGVHPEYGEDVTVEDLLLIYADHCDAHIDQIERTLAAAPLTK